MQFRLAKAIKHYEPFSLIQKLNPVSSREDETCSTLQLAAQYGRLDVIAWLIEGGVPVEAPSDIVKKHQPLAAQFLAACGGNLLTYEPLSVTPAITNGIFFRAKIRNQKKLMELTELNQTIFAEQKKEENPVQDMQENHESFLKAYQQKDYLTLKLWCEKADESKYVACLKTLLSLNEKDCSLFLIMVSGMNVFDIALQCKDEVILQKLIEFTWNEIDLTNELINHSIIENKLPSHPVVILLEKQINKIFFPYLFTHCINSNYPELNYHENHLTSLTVKQKEFVLTLASRFSYTPFKIQLPLLEGFDNLPPSLLQIIISYIDESKKQEYIAGLSQRLFDCVLAVNPKIGRGRYNDLFDKLELLQPFTKATNQYLKKNFICKGLKLSKREKIAWLLIFLFLLALEGIFAGFWIRKLDIKNKMLNFIMKDPWSPPYSCWSNTSDGNYCEGPSNENCRDLCNDLLLSQEISIITGAISNAGFLLCIYVLMGQQRARTQPNQPITRASQSIVDTATRMLDGFQEFKDNPFQEQTLENTLESVFAIASSREREILKSIAQLEEEKNKEFPETSPVEVAQIDIQETDPFAGNFNIHRLSIFASEERNGDAKFDLTVPLLPSESKFEAKYPSSRN